MGEQVAEAIIGRDAIRNVGPMTALDRAVRSKLDAYMHLVASLEQNDGREIVITIGYRDPSSGTRKIVERMEPTGIGR